MKLLCSCCGKFLLYLGCPGKCVDWPEVLETVGAWLNCFYMMVQRPAAHWLTNLVHGDKSVRYFLPPSNPCSSIGTVWTTNQRVKGSKRTKRCKLSTWQIILYLFYLKLHHFLYFCATISLKHNNLKWLTLWLTLTLSFGAS